MKRLIYTKQFKNVWMGREEFRFSNYKPDFFRLSVILLAILANQVSGTKLVDKYGIVKNGN